MTEPQIRKIIARRSFCTLASTSADGRLLKDPLHAGGAVALDG